MAKQKKSALEPKRFPKAEVECPSITKTQETAKDGSLSFGGTTVNTHVEIEVDAPAPMPEFLEKWDVRMGDNAHFDGDNCPPVAGTTETHIVRKVE